MTKTRRRARSLLESLETRMMTLQVGSCLLPHVPPSVLHAPLPLRALPSIVRPLTETDSYSPPLPPQSLLPLGHPLHTLRPSEFIPLTLIGHRLLSSLHSLVLTLLPLTPLCTLPSLLPILPFLPLLPLLAIIRLSTLFRLLPWVEALSLHEPLLLVPSFPIRPPLACPNPKMRKLSPEKTPSDCSPLSL